VDPPPAQHFQISCSLLLQQQRKGSYAGTGAPISSRSFGVYVGRAQRRRIVGLSPVCGNVVRGSCLRRVPRHSAVEGVCQLMELDEPRLRGANGLTRGRGVVVVTVQGGSGSA